MNSNIYEQLLKVLPKEKIYINEPMSKHTSLRIGGPADFLVEVTNIKEIQEILKLGKAQQIHLTIIGNGTNILVSDNGIRGIVIKINLQEYEVILNEDYGKIIVQAGMPLAKLSQIAEENSLTGLEFACGIPGTVGGSIRMNAGAYGGEMQNIVESTTYIDSDGVLKTINNTEHEFSYRNSIFSKINAIILNTQIVLKKGNILEIQSKMKQNMEQRKQKQAINYPNAGSTFKRGSDFITAQLIDQCGLKGYRIGDAMVSTVHAGFLVNTGNATCNQMLELIAHVKNEVKNKCNKDIELEVLFLE